MWPVGKGCLIDADATVGREGAWGGVWRLCEKFQGCFVVFEALI